MELKAHSSTFRTSTVPAPSPGRCDSRTKGIGCDCGEHAGGGHACAHKCVGCTSSACTVPGERLSNPVAFYHNCFSWLTLPFVLTVHNSQDVKSFGLISMGVAAVGASATAGLTATDAQRLKMVVSGMGPSAHPAAPLPEAASLETAATEEATKVEEVEEAAKAEEAEEAGEGMEGVEAAVVDGMEE